MVFQRFDEAGVIGARRSKMVDRGVWGLFTAVGSADCRISIFIVEECVCAKGVSWRNDVLFAESGESTNAVFHQPTGHVIAIEFDESLKGYTVLSRCVIKQQ